MDMGCGARATRRTESRTTMSIRAAPAWFSVAMRPTLGIESAKAMDSALRLEDDRLQLDCVRCIFRFHEEAPLVARIAAGRIPRAGPATVLCALFDHAGRQQGVPQPAEGPGPDIPAVPRDAGALGA